MTDTKQEMIEKAANNGSYSTDRLYAAYDRYANGFFKPVRRKVKNEKDRNSRNKKKRQSRSL